MESILYTIKKMIGLEPDYDVFDQHLIVLINAAFFELYQLGVHSDSVFKITDEKDSWDDFGSYEFMDAVKTFIYLKTLRSFDSPTSSVLVNTIDKELNDLQFRLMVESDDYESRT